VVDITHHNAAEQAATVTETLDEIGATHSPVLVALNKIDRLANPDAIIEQLAQYPNSLGLSAQTGQGLPTLLARIEGVLQTSRQTMRLLIPYQRGDVVALLHQQAIINRQAHLANGTQLDVFVPEHLREIVEPFEMGTGSKATAR
jgi:GTP-binding protein HflX